MANVSCEKQKHRPRGDVLALWFEVLHSRVCLVGRHNGRLLPAWAYGGGVNFILWKKVEYEQHQFHFCDVSHRRSEGWWTLGLRRCGNSSTEALPVVSLSDFCQSRMTKEGQPSTATTVTLDGGIRGGLVTFRSLASSSGKWVREEVMEHGSSGFLFVL